jgi:hypothetical protein
MDVDFEREGRQMFTLPTAPSPVTTHCCGISTVVLACGRREDRLSVSDLQGLSSRTSRHCRPKNQRYIHDWEITKRARGINRSSDAKDINMRYAGRGRGGDR